MHTISHTREGFTNRPRSGPDWVAVVARHTGLLRGIALAYRLGTADADDVVQLTWLTLHERAGDLRDPGRLGGWLATVARRHSLGVLRSRRRELLIATVPVEVADVDRMRLPEPYVLFAADRALVREAVATLPPRYRSMLVAWADGEVSRTRLAALAGVTPPSVGRVRGRRLALLRHRLTALGVHG